MIGHRNQDRPRVPLAVITASDSRTMETDGSGGYLATAAEGAGHDLVHRALVREDPGAVRAAVEEALAHGARAVLVTGGTGVAPRDRTPEAVRPLVVRELPGFGELFRLLSFQEIGAAATLSRALAGVTKGGAVIFALPGSTGACRTAWEKLIAPELGHLVALSAPSLEEG